VKHAFLKGIDPKGKKAPATMHEAVDKLIKNLRGGKLTNSIRRTLGRANSQKTI